jgi:succinate-acetate transporter protein
LSVSEEHAVAPPTTGIANPAPLGLAAFALTTFLLSAKNADWMSHAGGLTFVDYAFAYGGLCQLLAGMWEFRNRNIFGATAFSTYGGFWIGLYFWVKDFALGWILLAFAVINTYLLIFSTQVNLSVFIVFLVLEATEIVGAIAQFDAGSNLAPTGLVKVTGYIGIVTALAAWYASAAALSEGMAGKIRLPLGDALIS